MYSFFWGGGGGGVFRLCGVVCMVNHLIQIGTSERDSRIIWFIGTSEWVRESFDSDRDFGRTIWFRIQSVVANQLERVYLIQVFWIFCYRSALRSAVRESSDSDRNFGVGSWIIIQIGTSERDSRITWFIGTSEWVRELFRSGFQSSSWIFDLELRSGFV